MPVTRPSGVSGARPADSRPLPTIIAAGILAVSLVAAFAFVSLRGGLALPTGFRPGAAASQAPSPPGSAAPTVAPTIASSPTAIPTPVSPAPASPTLAPAATASLPAAYAGLPPCPDRPDCYLYRVRSGDNLTRIADHFGITTKALKAANPEISNPNLLHVGDQLRIPLPPD